MQEQQVIGVPVVQPDEVELFINGKSQGRKKKEPLTYRIRWNDARYEPGEAKVVAYKDGKQWAETKMLTADVPKTVRATADRTVLTETPFESRISTRAATDMDLTPPLTE